MDAKAFQDIARCPQTGSRREMLKMMENKDNVKGEFDRPEQLSLPGYSCEGKQVNQRYSAWIRRQLSPLKLQISNSHMGVSID